jgi:hypothetical protein
VDGRGKLSWTNGSNYTGQFRDGVYHGSGCYLDATAGTKFVGQWDHGRKHGHGRQTWSSGQSYTGNYRLGQRHGYGRMVYADGTVYAGGWSKSLRHGYGIRLSAKDVVLHCGLWERDLPLVSNKDSSIPRQTQDDLAILRELRKSFRGPVRSLDDGDLTHDRVVRSTDVEDDDYDDQQDFPNEAIDLPPVDENVAAC